jgi:amino acid transporter
VSPTAPSSSELKREFTFRSTFSLAFAFISPIIGLYTIFALALGAAGPVFWFGFLVVLAFQLLVALVLAELSSVWPMAGGLYKWTQRLAGATAGWSAGWAYAWTLILLITAQSFAAAPFLAGLLDIDAPGTGLLIALAALILLAATGANLLGPRALKAFVAVSISAELIGSAVIGTVLLLFYREQPLSALLDGVGQASPALAPMLAAVALIGWSFIGFESAGDIAEEVDDPQRQVPRAIVLSLVVVAAIVMYAALALVLAIPDLGAVLSGKVDDPIIATLTAQLGSGVAKPLFAVVVLAFVAGIVAVQASVARVLFAFGRDGELPASPWLCRLSGPGRIPRNAVVASGGAGGALLVVALSDNAYATLISMATVGFYISFAFPVLGALRARLLRRWEPGPFQLGRFGLAVNAIAAGWLVFEIVNIAWPRLPGTPWYVNYGAALMVVLIAAVGLVVRTLQRSRSAVASPIPAGEPVG